MATGSMDALEPLFHWSHFGLRFVFQEGKL
jgi:hypothetical protein